MSEIGPEPRRFEQNFRTLGGEKLCIPCRLHILLDTIGDIGIDMRLGRACREIS
ncbi:hypothetical protein D3C75_1292160 [compost metagenome]